MVARRCPDLYRGLNLTKKTITGKMRRSTGRKDTKPLQESNVVSGLLPVFRKLKQVVRDFGWLDSSLYALERTLARTTGGWARIERFVIVAQPLADRPILPPGRGRKIAVTEIRPGHAIVNAFPRPPAVIKTRYDQGAICFAATRDDRFLGFIWLVTEAYDEDVVRARYLLHPAGKTAWDFDVYVAPGERLGLTFPRLWDTASGYLRERGIRWSLSRISAFNPASLAAHRRLGARRIGSATFLLMGSVQLMLSSFPPYLHLSLGRSVPVLRLTPPETGVKQI